MNVEEKSQKKATAATAETVPKAEKPVFIVDIEYDSKKNPTLSLRYIHKPSDASANIDLKRSSSDLLTNQILDDCLATFVRNEISKKHQVKLSENPEIIAEKHDAGRIRREVSHLRRVLMSHPGEAIREDDEEEDYEDDGPRPFATEATLIVALNARSDQPKVRLNTVVTTEQYGDICSAIFQKAILDPILSMMDEAGRGNHLKGSGVIGVRMKGLHVPGLREYLAKELHRMKVGGAGATKVAPVKNTMPSEDVIPVIASFLETKLSMADDLNTYEQSNGHILEVGFPGANMGDKATRQEETFATILDQSHSWPTYNSFRASSAFSSGTLGGIMFGLTTSDEEDYYSDMSFGDGDEDY